MIKKSMSQEYIIILNMCVPNNKISQHEAEADRTARKKMEESTVSLEKSTLLFAEVPRSSRQKISRDIIELNSTINQLDAIDIRRVVHPTRTEYIFSSSQGT